MTRSHRFQVSEFEQHSPEMNAYYPFISNQTWPGPSIREHEKDLMEAKVLL